MTSNLLHIRYLTLQKAVDDVIGSTGSEEKNIVILPPAQGDVDVCHKNDLLPNYVAETLEVHNNDECEVASYVSAVQSKENKPLPKKKNVKAVLWKKKSSLKKIPEANVMHLADLTANLILSCLSQLHFFEYYLMRKSIV